jgi:hypothetical protein
MLNRCDQDDGCITFITLLSQTRNCFAHGENHDTFVTLIEL